MNCIVIGYFYSSDVTCYALCCICSSGTERLVSLVPWHKCPGQTTKCASWRCIPLLETLIMTCSFKLCIELWVNLLVGAFWTNIRMWVCLLNVPMMVSRVNSFMWSAINPAQPQTTQHNSEGTNEYKNTQNTQSISHTRKVSLVYVKGDQNRAQLVRATQHTQNIAKQYLGRQKYRVDMCWSSAVTKKKRKEMHSVQSEIVCRKVSVSV
jgi:hypothetical protein